MRFDFFDELSELDDEILDKHVELVFKYFRKRGLPYYSYTKEEKLVEFQKIKKINFNQGIKGGEILQILNGIGLAWSYFPHHWEVQVLKMKRPIDVFNDDHLLKKALRSRIKWGGKFLANGFMTDSNLRKAIRTASGVQAVSNFRPVASASIYYKYAPNGKVWDMSCGFGGRLFGALACGIKKYIGTDPCHLTFEGLNKIKKDFEHLNTEVALYKQGSESFVPNESVDLCFTSPPYFNTEEYSNETSQSFKKFPSQDAWKNGFLRQTVKNCRSCLARNGHMIINIANVKTFKDLEAQTLKVCREEGFALKETLKLRLSSINGGFKYEPVFVFAKNNY
tara:strand:+ start:139 stop:1149 length:1011 start_codon:yes stop_codon:yes gene_type:complete